MSEDPTTPVCEGGEGELASPSSPSEDEIMVCTETVDPAAVAACRSMSQNDIQDADAYVMQGLHWFFGNRISDAEEYFRVKSHIDPMCACAYGCVAFLRAVMSFSVEDLDAATNRLVYAYKFADAILPQTNVVAKTAGFVGKLLRISGDKVLTPCEFRASVIKAEAELLRGTLLLLQESMTSYIRAGLALRRGYNIYDSLQKNKGRAAADINSEGGLLFGLGMINLVLSLMPPRILSLISLMGYMHNRERGEEYLNKCIELNGIRCPLASLFLMVMHGVMPSFANPLVKTHIPIALQVADTTMKIFPDSCIHLWLYGRTIRMHREVEKSIEVFQKSIASVATQPDFVQIKHLALYEMAWCYCYMCDWKNGAECFNVLQNESTWSKAFYAYAQGACYDMMGLQDKAMEFYVLAPTFIKRKFAGKLISVEQYVQRKHQLILKHGKNTKLAIVELMFLFNAFPQMAIACMTPILDLIGKALSEGDFVTPDEDMSLRLIQACLHREMGRTAEAVEGFRVIREHAPLTEETWVQPYAMYEHAVLDFATDDREEGENKMSALGTKFGGKDYNFEMQLSWRIHLTKDMLKRE